MLQKHASRKEIMQTLCIAGYDAGKRAKKICVVDGKGYGRKESRIRRRENAPKTCVAEGNNADVMHRRTRRREKGQKNLRRGRKGARQEERGTARGNKDISLYTDQGQTA